MAAVPIYVWNGTAWQETGPTIPASPIKYQASAPTSPSTGDIWVDSDADVTSGSQQFQRFRFVASGGETTISGNDANGATLAYTAGAELVVLNGSTLVRGQDYTATNGTSITGLSPALVASDVLEVFSFIAFTVANTYTQSQVDGLLASKVYFSARISTSQSIASTTWTKVAFDTEILDSGNVYDTTNYRFTVPAGKGGIYLLGFDVAWGVYSAGHQVQMNFYKNGSADINNIYPFRDGSSDVVSTKHSKILELSAGDYVEAYAFHNRGSNTTFYSPNGNFWGFKI